MGNETNQKLNWRGFFWAALKMSNPFADPSLDVAIQVLNKALLGENQTPLKHEVVQQKLNVAMTALNEASEFISNVDRQLSAQKQHLDAVMESYRHYQRLAGLEKAKADAFIHEMAAKITEGAQRERIWSFAINLATGIIVFVVGVVASDKVKSLWNLVMLRF